MRIRNRQMRAQSGLCYYCEQPMWLQDINGFCDNFGVNRDQAVFLKCTAEHLIARTDGGLDNDQNIVAACHYCNQSRHLSDEVLSPDKFMVLARAELKVGRWHGLLLGPEKGV